MTRRPEPIECAALCGTEPADLVLVDLPIEAEASRVLPAPGRGSYEARCRTCLGVYGELVDACADRILGPHRQSNPGSDRR